MRDPRKTLLILAALAGVGAALCGCVDTRTLNNQIREADEFGHAVREDLAAQIANPDPSYKGPPPPYSGARTALAQTAYRADTVKQPVATTTSTTIAGGGGN
jgi:hypothetical protein